MDNQISSFRLDCVLANQLSSSITSRDIHYKCHRLLNPINSSGISPASIDPWRHTRSVAILSINNDNSMRTPSVLRKSETFASSYMRHMHVKFH